MTTPVVYPTTLPNPEVSVVTPAERRLLSDVTNGPQQARGVQLDYLGTQQVQFFFNPTDAATFDTWWKTTLIFGGAWFASNWPSPQGFVAIVRRFVDKTLKWDYLPGGFWRVTSQVQVRGRGMLPVQYAYDPHLKFLMHLNSNYIEEIGHRLFTPTSGGTMSFSNAEFGKGFSWNQKVTGSAPNNSIIWTGTTPVIPNPSVTGWTVEFWINVVAAQVSGPTYGYFPFFRVNSDFTVGTAQISSSVPPGLYCGASGGRTNLGNASVGMHHVRICYNAGSYGGLGVPVDWFFDGAYIDRFPISIPDIPITSVEFGDMSTFTGFGTTGTIDEIAIFDTQLTAQFGTFAVPTAPYARF